MSQSSQSFDYHRQPTINETRLRAVLFDHWTKATPISESKLRKIIFSIQEGYDPNNKTVLWKDVRNEVLGKFFPFPQDAYVRRTYASVLGSYFSRGRRRVKKTASPKKKGATTQKSDALKRPSPKKVRTHTEPNGQLVWDL